MLVEVASNERAFKVCVTCHYISNQFLLNRVDITLAEPTLEHPLLALYFILLVRQVEKTATSESACEVPISRDWALEQRKSWCVSHTATRLAWESGRCEDGGW